MAPQFTQSFVTCFRETSYDDLRELPLFLCPAVRYDYTILGKNCVMSSLLVGTWQGHLQKRDTVTLWELNDSEPVKRLIRAHWHT